MREIGGNARVWLLVAELVGPARVAAAPALHVVNDCPRLSATEYDELDARLLLLLQSAGRSGAPRVICDEQGAKLEWQGERAVLPEQESLADEAVSALQAWLEPRRGSIASEPRFDDDSPVRVVRPKRTPSGPYGVALGFELEQATGTLKRSLGPVFDFGLPLGPLHLGSREVFRFTLGGQQASLLGVQALLAYGAPFDPAASWGAALRGGGECLVAYPSGGATQVACLPAFGGGLRVARSFGTLGLWMGADLNLRTAALRLDLYQERVETAPLSASLTLGVVINGGGKSR
jgi:hypothetical protein